MSQSWLLVKIVRFFRRVVLVRRDDIADLRRIALAIIVKLALTSPDLELKLLDLHLTCLELCSDPISLHLTLLLPSLERNIVPVYLIL